MAKSRVAHLKKLTLPQLELMAAVLGARLSSYLQAHLQASDVYLWSDSQIVLHWLSSKKELKRFVHNRVTGIQSFTENASWNYCPTGDNPADLPTRGMQTCELSTFTLDLWSRVRSWLNTKKNWPSWNSKSVLLQSTAAEQLEAIFTFTSESTNNPTNVPEPKHGIAKIINLSAHSNIHKLVRVTAWLLRFVYDMKKRLIMVHYLSLN
jgi:hypothetical protein